METKTGIDLSNNKSIGHSWGHDNELNVFPRTKFSSLKGSGGKSSSPQTIKVFRWNSVIQQNPASRALISESASVFKSIQRVGSGLESLSRNELIKASRKYRSVIHSCYTRLRNDSLNSHQSVALSQMFYQIEIIWNLSEILYMDIYTPGYQLNQLLTWIRWHFIETVTMAETIISADVPHIHKDYWNVIINYLLRGEVDHARRFIELHPDADSKQEFILVRDVLKKMPTNSPNQVFHEYYIRWRVWSDESKQLLREGHFDINDKLETIMRIVAGDVTVFNEIMDRFESWYHLLVSYLLFTDPCIKENTLANLSDECIDLFCQNGRRKLTQFDSLIKAVFHFDLMQVIQGGCTYFNDCWWFATHFLDLLFNANYLDQQIDSPAKLREFFVVDYANSLMSNDSLWQFGIDYLTHCPDSGLNHIQLNLQRVPIINEISAQKVIHAANKLGFNHISKSVCKILSRKYLRSKRLGSALFWAVRSEDITLTTHMADLFLSEYRTTKQFPDEDILSNLGPSMLISDRLTFLAKYYEFHQLKKECKLQNAADLLVSLLSSRIAPKFFVGILLMDALPLLESQTLVVSGEQTCQLLASLEDILANTPAKDESQFLKEREDILRLAIARNLARAFVLPIP